MNLNFAINSNYFFIKNFIVLFLEPPPPKNLSVKKRLSTSVVVSWEQPDDPRGNITKYRIIYWGKSAIAKGLEVKSSRYYNEYTITGLQPYNTYKLQVSISFVFFYVVKLFT